MDHGRLRELEWQRDDLWRQLGGFYREALARRKLYEEVEFVCGRCHGTIDPGAAIPEAAGNALEALYEAQLPVREVLAALWEKGAS
jgi:hypothetical protein